MTKKALATKRDEEVAQVGPMEAAVVRVEEGRVVVRVRAGAPEETARVALPGYSAATGDRVLVQRAAVSASLYVVGVTHTSSARSLSAPGGARATVEGDTVAIHDAGGALVAAYDGATGELRLAAPGDLRLSAPAGRVILEGAAVAMETDDLAVRASSASFAVGQWELRAERVVERVTDAFRSVDGLLETRAKRMRTLVATTLELFGKRTTITSEKDTRIDGERVLLG